MEFISTQAKFISAELKLVRFLRTYVGRFCPFSGDFNRLFKQVILVSAIALLSLLSFATPALAAKDRLFLDLSLEYLGEYQPPTNISNAPAGFSAITYDKRRDRFYAISGNEIVTLKLSFKTAPEEIKIQNIELESVTSLLDKDGKLYDSETFFAKGIALTPQQTVYISGSQISGERSLPFIREFDLKNGRMLQSLTLPKRYIAKSIQEKEQNQNTQITQDDITFAALAFNATGTVPTSGEPVNLFTATESTLVQDRDTPNSKQGKARLLHYLIGYGTPMLLAEYAYPLDAELEELLSVEGVHFLSLELQPETKTGKIYQVVTSGATDTSKVEKLKGKIKGVREIKKKLVSDLQELGITLENSSGMTFGSRLSDGTKSLLVMSHDQQVTNFLLFRLHYQ
ncbi:esterase-like activity of phytase family protein [Chroococcidiopsis sp. FACHB-1243]|uniref:esterase-like activity of phytase family protein n=1 Tax=Chroococcidiopsis sp. [FACHB-1243] TaxID=2692781 RepID=UPI00177F6C1D|nr:esterase-like activity of phytase family protein [Chroococcidiopsis sp. [FACHB-1243]]MBD2304028.1 esterase-like activity of phytase family protein [Chroococcidiopsis sp. [FACHB-1243]]